MRCSTRGGNARLGGPTWTQTSPAASLAATDPVPSFEMKLPGGEHAIVDIVKLRDCCLNSSHPRGRHKARVFASALGFTKADAEFLREQLLRVAREGSAMKGEADEHGERYIVDLPLARGNRRAMVRSAWIIRRSERIPAPRVLMYYCLRVPGYEGGRLMPPSWFLRFWTGPAGPG